MLNGPNGQTNITIEKKDGVLNIGQYLHPAIGALFGSSGMVIASDAPAWMKLAGRLLHMVCGDAVAVCSAATPGVEINAVLTAVGTYKSICFSSGTFTLEVAPAPLDGQRLFSNGGTIFEAGVVTTYLVNINDKDDVTIKGIEFDGNDTCNKGIYATNLNNLVIERCELHNFQVAAIDIDGGATEGGHPTAPIINKCYIHNCNTSGGANTGNGIRIGYDGNRRDYVKITDTTFYYNRIGIQVVNGSNGQVSNCAINSNQYGIYLLGTNTERISFLGCDVNHNTKEGIVVSNGGLHSFTNCYFLDNYWDGVGLATGCYECTFVNCDIHGNGEDDPGDAHDCEIWLSFAPTGHIFSNCRIGRATKTDPIVPIYVANANTDVKLVDCVIIKTGSSYITNPSYITNLSEWKGNKYYIVPGEIRTASGSLVPTGTCTATTVSGTFTESPLSLKPGANTMHCTASGTINVVMPAGSTAVVTSGDATVTGSPKTCPAGATTLVTVATGAGADDFTITVHCNAFAWHNPELQDIFIRKIVINRTAAGGTATSELNVGIADNGTVDDPGTEFFNNLPVNNAAALHDSYVAGGTSYGTQTIWVSCEDSASATGGWVVAKLDTEIADLLAGTYVIEYCGKP